MIRNLFAGTLLAAMAATAPAYAAVNLIQNGGFEEPQQPLFGGTTYAQGSSDLPGWSISAGALGQGRLPALAFEGEQSASFLTVGIGGSSLPGTIQQSINTIVGAEYKLSFAYWKTFTNGIVTAIVSGIGTPLNFTDNAPLATSTWVVFSRSFIADSSVSTLTLAGSAAFIIDAVSITAVSAAIPEPATWAMMLIGFAGLGYAARRRREALAG